MAQYQFAHLLRTVKIKLEDYPDKNFSNMNLKGVSFYGENLRGANFAHSDLSGSKY